METETLTSKLDYYFSAFCQEFFPKTKQFVTQYDFAIPLYNFKDVLVNITASEEELKAAVEGSKYLRIENGKVVIPRAVEPFKQAVFIAAFPKCIPSYRLRQLLHELLGIETYVYDYIVASSRDQMSFVVNFRSTEDYTKFCEYFRHLTYEALSTENQHLFRGIMGHLRQMYESIDKYNPVVSIISKMDQLKQWVFWAEITRGIQNMHQSGLSQFSEVKEFRRQHHVENYKQKHQKTGKDPNKRPAKHLEAAKRAAPAASREQRVQKAEKSRFRK